MSPFLPAYKLSVILMPSCRTPGPVQTTFFSFALYLGGHLRAQDSQNPSFDSSQHAGVAASSVCIILVGYTLIFWKIIQPVARVFPAGSKSWQIFFSFRLFHGEVRKKGISMESKLAWTSQVQRSSLCAKKNTCKLAWEMHRVGQRTKLDRKPESTVTDSRRVCQDPRMWKVISHTCQLLLEPAIFLHAAAAAIQAAIYILCFC